MRARRSILALALATAILGAAVADATAAGQKVKAPPAGKLYWGDYRAGSPYSRRTVRAIEKDAGRKPAVVMWFQEWAGKPPFPYADAAWLARRGEVPMLTWEAWQPKGAVVDQPRYRLKRIASGAFDPFIKSYARQVRDYGGPLMLRPFHEMDGVWYPWGGMANGNKPKDFVAAWRHVHKVFDRVGARNVTWVWSVNRITVPDTPANSIAHYWPGSKYVDWVGISAFNFASVPPGTGDWEDLDQLLSKRLAALQPYDKPVFITETSSIEDGGDKGAWIRSLPGQLIGGSPRVGGFVWYDRRDSTAENFPFTSSAASWDAFRAIVSGGQILSAPSALPGRSR